jgi:hypothetical protein
MPITSSCENETMTSRTPQMVAVTATTRMLFGRFGTGSTSAGDLGMLTAARHAFTTRALGASAKHRGVVEWGVGSGHLQTGWHGLSGGGC